MARKELSEAKRDLVATGNKRLRSTTVATLRESNSLHELRSRMGASATGFTSKHCKLTNFPLKITYPYIIFAIKLVLRKFEKQSAL